VGQFDCGRVPGWKTDCPGRMLDQWDALTNISLLPNSMPLRKNRPISQRDIRERLLLLGYIQEFTEGLAITDAGQMRLALG
jgi:hypothetical protein